MLMLRLGLLRIPYTCKCSTATFYISHSQLYAQTLQDLRKWDGIFYSKRKALQMAEEQNTLDLSLEALLERMRIKVHTSAHSFFWQSDISVKWPEKKIFSVKAISKAEVEERISEALCIYLLEKGIISDLPSCSKTLENDTSLVSHIQQIKALIINPKSDIVVRRAASAASVVGGASMFKRSISAVKKEQYEGTIVRMMHSLSLTDSSDEKPEKEVNVKKMRARRSPEEVSDDVLDVPSSKVRKVELSESGECLSITVTCKNDLVHQEATTSSSSSPRKKSKAARKKSVKKLKQNLDPVLQYVQSCFPAPWPTLHHFCKLVALALNSNQYELKTEFEQMGSSGWKCSLRMEWPESKVFSAIQGRKTEAAKQASLFALQWLMSNDKITKQGAPKELGSSTPSEDSLGTDAMQETMQLIDGTTQDTQHSSSDPFIVPEIKSRHVEMKQTLASEGQQVKKVPRRLRSLFPRPRHSINLFYQTLASELGSEDYKLEHMYKQLINKSGRWECTLQMQWPEKNSFSAIEKTKALAAHEASLLALNWLWSLDKITKQGLPIIYDSKEVHNSSTKISLDPEDVQKAEELLKVYLQSIKPLVDSSLMAAGLAETEIEDNDDKPDSDEFQAEQELYARGEPRNPVTGRILHEVSEKALNRRNNDLYRRSQKRTNVNKRGTLPISVFRDRILEEVENNQVVVIKGPPGCGKSTAVPQFIMEHFESKQQGALCNIIVTQPRRISAISLAEWIAREREEMLGDVVGYQVRFQKVLPGKSGGAMMFCTTGILLRRLVNNPGLLGASHIIVDEAHERDINTDFLLTLLRRALKLNPDLRVIIMSATINAELFQEYFNGAVGIHVPGFRYPIKSIFLDDFAVHKIPIKCATNPRTPTVNIKEVATLVQWIDRNRETDGAILCFLPGWAEIRKIHELLEIDRHLMVIPVHSKLEYKDQRKIFSPALPGTRKVILATNIAETSITITDVEYVIDTGMHREHRFDIDKGLPTFGNHWVSQASVNQRRGRAGRLKPGECFHLYTNSHFENLDPFPIPEILRTPLEKTVLDCKAYSRDEKAAQFLSQMPEAPSIAAVDKAVFELMQLDALDSEENLTALGKRIALFTLHPKLSIALIHGVVFRCLNPIVTIAAIFGNETELFSGVLTDKGVIKSTKKAFHPSSDHLAISWLFEKWDHLRIVNGAAEANMFCVSSKLQPDRMELIQKLRHLIGGELQECSMLKNKSSFADLESQCNKYVGIDEMVKGVLLSAFGTLLFNQDFDFRDGRLVKKNLLISDTGNQVTLGSESVNHGRKVFMSKFLIHFQETDFTDRKAVIVPETTMIAPLTVLLFVPGQFETTHIQSADKDLEGYVLLKHKRKHKLRLAMKEKEAELFLQLRTALWNTAFYFILQEGIVEESDSYRVIVDFHEGLLDALSVMLLKAGLEIEYKDNVLAD